MSIEPEPMPTSEEIDAEIKKWMAGKPSKIVIKNRKERPPEPEYVLPPGYEWVESPDIVPKPMTPELQEILDDAKLAGFEISGDLDDGIFIVKHRKGELPRGLQIMPDHVAWRVDQPAAKEISDYAVMRTVLELPPRPAS
jgi:hypothetical protein